MLPLPRPHNRRVRSIWSGAIVAYRSPAIKLGWDGGRGGTDIRGPEWCQRELRPQRNGVRPGIGSMGIMGRMTLRPVEKAPFTRP